VKMIRHDDKSVENDAGRAMRYPAPSIRDELAERTRDYPVFADIAEYASTT